jgi:hypothetical protein
MRIEEMRGDGGDGGDEEMEEMRYSVRCTRDPISGCAIIIY